MFKFYTCNIQCSSLYKVSVYLMNFLIMKPTDKIFWLRVVFGIFTGLILSVLTITTNFAGQNGILFAILMYITSYYIARIKFSSEIPLKDSRKIFTTGLGSFIMLFLFTWILLNTLFVLR